MRQLRYMMLWLTVCLWGCGGVAFDQRMSDQIKAHGLQNETQVVLVDYDRSVYAKRLFVVNPKTKKILFASKAGHAWKSGMLYPSKFSNTPRSNLSSLGLYEIGKEYYGKFGRSLRLHGLSKSNSNVLIRAIVLHRQPSWRLWSLGCITIPNDETDKLIDLLKKGTKMVVYK